MKNIYLALLGKNSDSLPVRWLVMLLMGFFSFSAQAQTISGTVFRDFNSSGAKDNSASFNETGVGGVHISAYTTSGVLATSAISSTVTATLGQYSLNVGNTNTYRIEFTNLPVGDYDSFKGAASGTSVQFINGGTTNVNLGINLPEEYCQANPKLVIPCYDNGSGVGNTNPVVVSLDYTNTGSGLNTYPTNANADNIGSTWGVAYDKKTRLTYLSAFLKRQAGIGDRGLDGIYVVNYGATAPALVGGFDLEGVVPSNGGGALAFGSVTRTLVASGDGDGINELSADRTRASRDDDAYAKVGKVGYGDIDIDQETNTLWAVNLNERSLLAIDLSTALQGAAIPNTLPGAKVRRYFINGTTSPFITGLPACPSGVMRPFGLKLHNGIGYLGVVCDGSTLSTVDMTASQQAYVLSFDPTTPTAFTQVTSVPLNYGREQGWVPFSPTATFDALESDKWQRWVDTYTDPTSFGSSVNSTNQDFKTGINGIFVGAPQPILADIEFLPSGDIILGFMDRFAHQQGWNNFIPGSSLRLRAAVSQGDVLLGSKTTSGYTFEGPNENDNFTNPAVAANAQAGQLLNDGPSGAGEFFYGDYYIGGDATHPETALGGLGILPGSNELTAVSFDPAAFNSMGIRWLNSSTGVQSRVYTVVANTDIGNFGKGSALGDVELLCNLAPIQIGNRVWRDTDNDGVQDAGEPALAGIRVQLSGPGVPANTTVLTGTNGEYYFSNATGTNATGFVYSLTGLTSGSSYSLTFPTSTSAGVLLLSSKANSATGSNADAIDTDASPTGIISFTLGSAGQNNFSYDAAYAEIPPCLVSLTATPGTCQPATNQYTLTGTVNFTATPGGILTISDDGANTPVVTTTVSVPASATSITFSLTGLGSGGRYHLVTASFSTTACGTQSMTYLSPVSCTAAPCIGTNLLTNPSFEQGFPAQPNGQATQSPPPGWVSGTSDNNPQSFAAADGYAYGFSTDNGSLCQSVSATAGSTYSLVFYAGVHVASGQTVTLSFLNSSSAVLGTPRSFTSTYILESTNSFGGPYSLSGVAPTGTTQVRVCAVSAAGTGSNFWSKIDNVCLTGTTAPCNLSVAVTTPVCNSATNTYTATGTISLSNTPAGSLIITDGARSTTVTVGASATSVAYSLSGLTSGTGSHTITVSLAGCGSAVAIYSAPASCTVAPVVCSFSATAQATCNNNGTLANATDDFLAILLTPTGPFGRGFTLSATQAGNPISLSLSNGNSFTSLSYGYPTPLRAPAGTPGSGNIILTLTDLANTTCTQQVTVTDPGACTAGACVGSTPQTVTYSYRTPFLTTDLENEPIRLPQFNDPSRTLTKVDLSYGILEGSNLLVENTAATAQNFRPTITSDVSINLGAATLLNPNLSYTPGFIAMPAGITVTAQGSYGGDLTYGGGTNVSTLEGMKSWLNAYMQDIFVNPTTDPRWVTNATGSATTDDDIYVMPVQSLTAAGVSSFTSAADLAQFLGTGQVPDFSVSTLNGIGFTGGGGNLLARQNTKAYGYATVTYTYTCNAAVCSLTATATPTICNSVTNHYTINGTISLTGNTAGGVATITDGARSTTVTVAASATSVAYSLTGLTSGTDSHTVTVSLAGCGSAVATYSAPASCTVCSLSLTTSALSNGQVGTAYSQTLTASGGTAPYTYSVLGTLPAGLNLSTAGVISGTPTTSGTASFTVKVTDAQSCSDVQPLTITVAALPVCSLTATATPGACNSITNQYSVTGTITSTNATVNNASPQTLTVSVGSVNTVVTLTGNGPVSYTLSGLNSDELVKTVSVLSSATACGSASVTYTAPASCTVAPPVIAVVVSTPVCNSVTNNYTATGTVSLSNAVASTLTITDNGATIGTISVTAGQTTASFPVSGVSNASNHTVVATLTEGISATTVYAAPVACTVCSLSLTTASLPNGQVGTAYSQTLTTSGGTAPLTYALASGSLPAGLTLNVATGEIGGIPTAAGTSSFTVTVTDAKSCSDAQPLTITISALPVCSLTATATPTACNSATNQYTVTGTISATNTAINSAATQSLTVSMGNVTTVVNLIGDGPVSYTLTGLNSDGLVKTVSVLSSATACGSASVTYTAPASCTVDPPALAVVVGTPVCNSVTNNYTATGTVSLSNATAGSLTITDNGTTVAVVSVTAGQTSASFSVSGVSGSSPASRTVVASLGVITASTTYATPASCTVCSLSLTTTMLAQGQVGTAYSQTLTTSGGTAPLTYALASGSLPAGLTLNAATGEIGGTPTATGTSSFTVTVTDAKSCSDAQPLTITTSALPVCSLTATATPTACNSATNQYTVTGTVSATNTTGNQSLTVSVGSINTVVALTGNGPVSYTLAGLTSDGLGKTVSVLSSATACGAASVTFTAPASCTVAPLTPTLLLAKMVSASKAKPGDVISYTIVLANTGPVAATNVVVTDNLSAGQSLVPGSVTASMGSYTPGSNWTIASLPASTSATLIYSTRVLAEGVLYNTASIPGDEVKVCTSVPYAVCKGVPYAIEVTAPAGYSRYQWYVTTPTGTTLVSDITATSANAATAGSYTITQAGEYKVVVDEDVAGSCPDMSCCPVIVDEVEVPPYTAIGKNPTCVGTTPQANGQITLMNLGVDPTVYVYQVSTGSSFSAATALSATPVAVPANGIVATGLAGGNYTVRVWVLIDGQPSCPRDVTVALVANCDCPEEICVPVIIRKTKSITGQ